MVFGGSFPAPSKTSVGLAFLYGLWLVLYLTQQMAYLAVYAFFAVLSLFHNPPKVSIY
jgi:hypothetical protein